MPCASEVPAPRPLPRTPLSAPPTSVPQQLAAAGLLSATVGGRFPALSLPGDPRSRGGGGVLPLEPAVGAWALAGKPEKAEGLP